MGTLGIDANGEIVSAAGDNVAGAIELYCSDPDFLERATRKRPNAVTEFVGGTFSYMRDWGLGVNFCLGLLGIYGSDFQSRCTGWGRMAIDIVDFAFTNPELAYKLISLALQHTYSTPRFVGRLAGSGVINTLMLTGGRYGAGIRSGKSVPISRALSRSSALKPSNYTNGAMRTNAPVMGANFVLALTGSTVATIKYGNADIASVFSAMLTGDYESDFIGSLYRDLFTEAQRLGDVEISPEELQAMLVILEAVEYCIKNPGEFGGRTEPRREVPPQVPVGQVSSARPTGVMGLIDAGSETNMLDVISDQNARFR